MGEQQYMKQRRDALRLLLQQQMGPEEAAQYELYLDSLVGVGFTTAGRIRHSNWQVLEKTGLPSMRIIQLGTVLDIPGDPPAKCERELSLMRCCKDAHC